MFDGKNHSYIIMLCLSKAEAYIRVVMEQKFFLWGAGGGEKKN